MKTISLKRLKMWSLTLPTNHPLRKVLLAENDEITEEEFIVKARVWDLLANEPS